MTDDENLFDEALGEWGEKKQLDIFVEECGELIQAAMKNRRNDVELAYDAQFIEELVDLEIMIEQFNRVVDPKTKDLLRDDKIARLENRLKESEGVRG